MTLAQSTSNWLTLKFVKGKIGDLVSIMSTKQTPYCTACYIPPTSLLMLLHKAPDDTKAITKTAVF